MNKNAVIEIEGVSFNYGAIPVLEDISLRIFEDEFIGIVGPNASGKSTLLKLILGLIKPDKGKITVSHSKLHDRYGRVGYVPQHITFPRNFPITVYETVLMGHVMASSYFFGYSKKEKKSTHNVLKKLGIDDITKRQISSLSGGQLQRVLIARALVCEPKILILDEPTANVDFKMEEDIFAFLKNYSKHVTIIIVSHDIGFISTYVDRVACLNRALVCHKTESISGKMIEDLYRVPVKMIDHHC